MLITRITRTIDGGSQFETKEIELVDAGEIGRLSEAYAVTSVVFRENDAGYDFDWHCAPRRDSAESFKSTALTIPHRTALASAITSTWWIWPKRT